MKSPASNGRAMTRLEVIIVLALLAVLAGFAFPAITFCGPKGDTMQAVSNGKQLALAAAQMALDRETTKDLTIGWPGDIKGLTTVGQYVDLMIRGNYLQKADVAKLLTAPGITPWNGADRLDGEKNCAFNFYKVRAIEGDNTLFLATRNYTYNTAFTEADAKKVPFGNKGFVVVQKGGSAVYLLKKQAQQITNVGSLPGYPDLTPPGTEAADSILAPK